ncbi:MAG: ribosome maturation factor RimP [Clostridia bacterium]|nr:ribosome maturation factor RimP [Clostridia bacterium]
MNIVFAQEVCAMAKNDNKTAVIVKDLLEQPINELGYDVWDVEFVKEGSEWFLRITIDSENGIDINDCEKVHRAIDPLLDDADPIETAYHLEVSSPGLERTIRTKEHFIKSVGEKVLVRLYAPRNGSRQFEGILDVSEDGEKIYITANGEKLEFDRAAISKANTVFDFE